MTESLREQIESSPITDEDIKAVARALCDVDLPQCGGSDGTRLNPEMPNWHHYRRDARAAIIAYRAVIGRKG